MANPIQGLGDSVAWPVLPLSPVAPVRKSRDLEPFHARYERTTGVKKEPPCLDQQREEQEVESPYDLPTVANLMCRRVLTISPDSTLLELETLLHKNHISGVPVTDPKTGELLGVVSQSDIARHLGLRSDATQGLGYYQSSGLGPLTCLPNFEEEAIVADIMTPYVYFATEDSSLLEVLDLMLTHHIHRVVITKESRLVGVVSSMDLLACLRGALSPRTEF